MKPSGFTEEHIIGILREHEAKRATFVGSTGKLLAEEFVEARRSAWQQAWSCFRISASIQA